MEVLVQRQYDLIECLGKVNSIVPTTTTTTGSEGARPASQGRMSSLALVDGVRKRVAEGAADARERIELLELLGQGSVSVLGIVGPSNFQGECDDVIHYASTDVCLLMPYPC
jgi:hypothetical protein